MTITTLLAWLRAKVRYDERGVLGRDALVTLAVVLVIIVAVAWLILNVGVHKK
jgi:hypothetical protein